MVFANSGVKIAQKNNLIAAWGVPNGNRAVVIETVLHILLRFKRGSIGTDQGGITTPGQ